MNSLAGAVAPNRSDLKSAYFCLFMLTIVYSFNFIDRQLIAILQEPIKADLNLSDTQLGLLSGFAFALFYVTAGIPIARLADRSNRKNIVALSVFIWSFMTCVCGMAQNYVHLLLARIGVGVGEAGGSPPSHSMISDLFPEKKRATALGLYSTGVNIGILFGFLLGGWINEFFGWRVAFVVVGLPGILLAVLVAVMVKEPQRGRFDGIQASAGSQTFGQAMRLLWSLKTFRYLSLASAMNAFAIYAVSNWSASFMIRTHGMDTGELGSWLALILGVGGAVGVVMGGVLSDRLSHRDRRYYLWLPMIALLIGVPGAYLAYSLSNPYAALTMLFFPGVLLNCYLGNVIATTHSLVDANMRATSSAVLFLIINIVGMGLGPSSVGMISDWLSDTHGTASLGLALQSVVPAAMVVAAILFYVASTQMKNDVPAMRGEG